MYGTEVSPTLISSVTDAVLDEVKSWQARPLDALYPIVYLDCIHAMDISWYMVAPAHPSVLAFCFALPPASMQLCARDTCASIWLGWLWLVSFFSQITRMVGSGFGNEIKWMFELFPPSQIISKLFSPHR